MEGYVFISYSTKNQALADAMRTMLTENSIKTWMAPDDIPAGSKYAKVINLAVKDCACCVLMLSKEAQDSIWVSKEIERAVNYRKPIVSVQIDDAPLNDEFELYISTDQIVSIKDLNTESKGVRKLLASLRSYVKSSESAAETEPPELSDGQAAENKISGSENVRENGRADAVNETVSKRYMLDPTTTGLKKYILINDSNLVGRDKYKCNIIIDGNYVSRKHAVINRFGDKWFVRDLNSTAGTYLNGIFVDPENETELKDGDVIQFADIKYIFRSISE